MSGGGRNTPPPYRALGSVTGKLVTVSVRGRPRCVVLDQLTRKPVGCVLLKDGLLHQAIDALGRRVVVRGVLWRNDHGKPVRVDADGIRVLRERHELPTTAELTGSDPDFTGGLSTEEYLRRQRA